MNKNLIFVLAILVVGYFIWKSQKGKKEQQSEQPKDPILPTPKPVNVEGCAVIYSTHKGYTGGSMPGDVLALMKDKLPKKWWNNAEGRSRLMGFFKAIDVQPKNRATAEYYLPNLKKYLETQTALLLEADILKGSLRCI